MDVKVEFEALEVRWKSFDFYLVYCALQSDISMVEGHKVSMFIVKTLEL